MAISKSRIEDIVTNFMQNLKEIEDDDVSDAITNVLSEDELKEIRKHGISKEFENTFIELFTKENEKELRNIFAAFDLERVLDSPMEDEDGEFNF